MNATGPQVPAEGGVAAWGPIVRASLEREHAEHAGRSFPLGATVFVDGVNFSVFSRQAGRLELLLFNDVADPHPAQVIELDARRHCTYHYWHAFVPG